ncbi:MAG: hypothetical protein U1D30_19845 [Planctomycetota bacterium]
MDARTVGVNAQRTHGARASTQSLWLLLFGSLVSLTLFVYLHASWRYPYYFMWDHDHGQCLDTLLIQSGKLPDHVATPGLGVNLIHVFTEKLAHAAGWLSVLDFADLNGSLNPIAAVAERVDFMRSHPPILAVATVLLIWLAFVLLFEPRRWEQVLLLLVFASSESFLYQSSMVRTELYSVFFWSASLAAVGFASRSRSKSSRAGWFLVSGIALGWAYLTKMQSLLLLPFIPLLFVASPSNARDAYSSTSTGTGLADDSADRARHGEIMILVLAIMNLVVIVALFAAARGVSIPAGVSVAGIGGRIESYRLSLSAFLLLAWCGLQVAGVWLRSLPDAVRSLLNWTTAITTGFWLSFGAHFLLFADPELGWTYLRWNAKILFFSRHFQQFLPLEDYVQQGTVLLQYDASMVASASLLFLLLVVAWLMGWLRMESSQVAACAGIFALSLLMATLGVRAFHRDTLWIAVSFLTCGTLCWMSMAQSSNPRWLGIVAALVISLQVGINLWQGFQFGPKLDALYTHYGWREDRFFSNLYGHNQPAYRMVMDDRYQGSQGRTFLALRHHALNHAQVRRAVSFAFPNLAITQKQIGVSARGQPVWVHHADFRIRELPDFLQGAFVVDVSSLTTLSSPIFSGNHAVEGREELVLLTQQDPPYPLVVLVRPDQEVYWFRLQKNPREPAAETLPRIVVSDGANSLSLVGTPIKEDTWIANADLSAPHFFVVKNALVAPTWSGTNESH